MDSLPYRRWAAIGQRVSFTYTKDGREKSSRSGTVTKENLDTITVQTDVNEYRCFSKTNIEDWVVYQDEDSLDRCIGDFKMFLLDILMRLERLTR